MIDSLDWIEANLDEFQKRLYMNVEMHAQASKAAEKTDCSKAIEDSPAGAHLHRAIEISIVRAMGKGQKGREIDPPHRASTVKDTFAAHQWLDSVDKFAELIASFWSKTRRDFLMAAREDRPEGVFEDVVIALIDDGVDAYVPSVSGQIVGGKSFDYSEFESVRWKPYYVSESGHGTVMASMIMRACPIAKLYPIRLKTLISEDGKRDIVLKSAALVNSHVFWYSRH